MDNKVTVDVIIAIHNGAAYIAEAVKSVFGQTQPVNHIYVINDGSTDSTVAEVKKLSHPTIPITLITIEKSGVSTARNIGIEKSSADYIAFLDADDVWLPEKIEKQIALLNEYPEYRLIYTKFQYVNERREPLPTPQVSITPETAMSGDVSSTIFYYINAITTSTVLVSRSALIEHGAFDAYLSMAEDSDLWLRLAKYIHYGYISESQVLIRRHDNNVTNDALVAIRMIPYCNKWISVFPKNSSFFRSMRQTLPYIAYKNKEYGNIKRLMTDQTALRLFPETGGSLALQIAWRLPFWIVKSVWKKFS